MRRTALCDTELEGQKIDEGDQVVMNYLCANRDESTFDDPLAFDVLRDPNPHIGYGGPGPHYCLGAHLARREIKVMFRELFDRIGDISATGEPDLLASAFIHGIKHLPAEFQATGASTQDRASTLGAPTTSGCWHALLVVPVADHHRVAAGAELSRLAPLDRVPGLGIDDLDLDVGMYTAHGAHPPADLALTRRRRGNRRPGRPARGWWGP